MSKELVGGWVVRFYPGEVRAARGQEILGTLLDAGDASIAAFGRQLASVMLGGLRERSERAFSQRPGTLAAHAVCWLAVIAIMRLPFGTGVFLLHVSGPVPTATVLDTFVLPLSFLALFTIGACRPAGLVGLAWLVLYVHAQPELLSLTTQAIGYIALPATGLLLMTLRPDAIPLAGQRALWILPALLWGLANLAAVSSDLGLTPALLAAPLGSLILLPLAPAFAIGTMTIWSAQYINWPTPAVHAVLLACTAAAILLTYAGRHAITRRAHG